MSELARLVELANEIGQIMAQGCIKYEEVRIVSDGAGYFIEFLTTTTQENEDE